MISFIKFAGATLFTIFSCALIATGVLGIYPDGSGWILNKNWNRWASKPNTADAIPTPSDDSKTISTASGDVTISATVDETKLGAPIYPGCERQGGGAVLFSDVESGLEEFTGVRFTTLDSFDQVVQFYKSRMSPRAHLYETKSEEQISAVFTLSSSDGHDTLGIFIIRKNDSPKTEIAIHRGTVRPSR